MSQYDRNIIELIESTARNFKALPLNLGAVQGSGGGVGAPPGGYIGWLPQTRVAYDIEELGTLETAASGSLLDNLNHIRYRLNILESGGSIIVTDDNNDLSYLDTTEIHFSGAGVIVTDLGGGEVKVTISAVGSGGGSPLIVEEYDGNPSVNNVDKIVFSGASVTDLGSGDVLVVFSGGSGFGSNEFYIDQSGGTSDTYGVLSGSVNGSNTVYTTSTAAYVTGSLTVYLNGQLQTQGTSEDWVETSPAAGTFTFNTAPQTGDLITACYQRSSTSSGNADTVDGYHASAFAVTAKGVTNGDSHDHSGGDGAQIDHGGLAGLSDDDHTQYVKKNTMEGHQYFPFGVFAVISPISTDNQQPYAGTVEQNFTLVNWVQGVYVVTTNDGSNYWKIQLKYAPSDATILELNTSAISPDGWSTVSGNSFSPSSITTASHKILYINVAKQGSPGSLYIAGPGLEIVL